MNIGTDERRDDNRHPVCVAVGQSLKAIRIAKKLSQAELALLAEVDRTFVSHIERGMTNPSVLSLDSLCYALGISLSVLFGPVTEAFPSSGRGEQVQKPRKRPLTPPVRRLR